MLVRAFGASTFGLRGGIPMEAAHTSVYHAPASCSSITRSIRIHTTYSLAKKCGVPSRRRGPLQKFQSALNAQRSGNMGQLCESRRYSAPLDTRATRKAPYAASAAISWLSGGVSLIKKKRVLYCSARVRLILLICCGITCGGRVGRWLAAHRRD